MVGGEVMTKTIVCLALVVALVLIALSALSAQDPITPRLQPAVTFVEAN